jgi:hypothetical protein
VTSTGSVTVSPIVGGTTESRTIRYANGKSVSSSFLVGFSSSSASWNSLAPVDSVLTGLFPSLSEAWATN